VVGGRCSAAFGPLSPPLLHTRRRARARIAVGVHLGRRPARRAPARGGRFAGEAERRVVAVGRPRAGVARHVVIGAGRGRGVARASRRGRRRERGRHADARVGDQRPQRVARRGRGEGCAAPGRRRRREQAVRRGGGGARLRARARHRHVRRRHSGRGRRARAQRAAQVVGARGGEGSRTVRRLRRRARRRRRQRAAPAALRRIGPPVPAHRRHGVRGGGRLEVDELEAAGGAGGWRRRGGGVGVAADSAPIINPPPFNLTVHGDGVVAGGGGHHVIVRASTGGRRRGRVRGGRMRTRDSIPDTRLMHAIVRRRVRRERKGLKTGEEKMVRRFGGRAVRAGGGASGPRAAPTTPALPAAGLPLCNAPLQRSGAAASRALAQPPRGIHRRAPLPTTTRAPPAPQPRHGTA